MATQIIPTWNHAVAARASSRELEVKDQNQVPNSVRDAAQTAGTTTGGSASNSASVSANDFLTLLVTEMQNQDPTANTDPNEYINQLVQVNSLEQLISINQTLTADSATVPSTDAAHAVGHQQLSATQTSPYQAGNLTVPHSNPAAQRVAAALGSKANGL